MNVSPAGDTTVAVGGQFDVSVALSTCGGGTHLNDSYTLMTEDPSVATVNGMRVSAVGEGATRVLVNGATYGRVATIDVTVTQ